MVPRISKPWLAALILAAGVFVAASAHAQPPGQEKKPAGEDRQGPAQKMDAQGGMMGGQQGMGMGGMT